MERFERGKFVEYMNRMLHSRKMSIKMLCEYCDWFNDHGDILELGPLDEKLCELIEKGRMTRIGMGDGLKLKDLALFKSDFLPLLVREEKKLARAKVSILERNLLDLQEELGLSRCEKETLGVMARYRIHKVTEDLLDCFKKQNLSEDVLLSLVIGESVSRVNKVIDQKSKLVQVGMLELQEDFLSKRVNLELPSQVLQALQKSSKGYRCFREFILGKPARASLLWEDFEHLGETRDKISRFLKVAARKRCKGINVLLYGPPGTGKTEFCKTLAASLDMQLYTVIESDEKGNEPSRGERISSLKLNHSLLSENRDALVLFDEMDDLFEWSLFGLLGGRPHGISKVFTNRLLENNHVPTFWTINNVEWLDPAIVSRMDLAIEIKVPPPEARTRVWERVLKKNKVTLPQTEIKKLARQEKVPPRIIQSAVRFSKLMGGSSDDIRFVTDGMVQAIQGGKKCDLPQAGNGSFLPELANTDVALDKLTSGLIGAGERRNFSLCLYGRPGTGKSAYARYLADQLGLEVLYRRSSDLIDKYVGESEKNIARMFEQARDEGTFLILDEADALLYDRRSAHSRYDISQVTEMLTWMESHPLPFACTTNLMENLDMASLRRFTFKVRFDYMTPKQNALAFQHFLGQKMPVSSRLLNNLSPGDYAVVANKARLLGELENPERLVEMLQAEVKARQEVAGSVGFAV